MKIVVLLCIAFLMSCASQLSPRETTLDLVRQSTDMYAATGEIPEDVRPLCTEVADSSSLLIEMVGSVLDRMPPDSVLSVPMIIDMVCRAIAEGAADNATPNPSD